MFSLLHQYLINCSSVVLPGIGTLQFANAPAQMANGLILSPKQTLVLVSNDIREDEPKKLIVFLSKHLDMPETQAHTLFEHFLQTIKNTIAEKKAMVWGKLGTFKQDDSGVIRFIQSNELDAYLPPVEATWINSHNASKYDLLIGESETNNVDVQEEWGAAKHKKNYWWVWAIIIAVVALTVIVYKFAY